MEDYKAGDKVKLTNPFGVSRIQLPSGTELELVNESGLDMPIKIFGDDDFITLAFKCESGCYVNNDKVNYLRVPLSHIEFVGRPEGLHACHCPIEQFTLAGSGCTCGGI